MRFTFQQDLAEKRRIPRDATPAQHLAPRQQDPAEAHVARKIGRKGCGQCRGQGRVARQDAQPHWGGAAAAAAPPAAQREAGELARCEAARPITASPTCGRSHIATVTVTTTESPETTQLFWFFLWFFHPLPTTSPFARLLFPARATPTFHPHSTHISPTRL